MTLGLENFKKSRSCSVFEEQLLSDLVKFNLRYFPSPEYKRKVIHRDVDEEEYAKDKEKKFLSTYRNLIKKHRIRIKQSQNNSFMDKWFLLPAREEIDFILRKLQNMQNKEVKSVLSIILSRAVRSCRVTPHADLGTLKGPVIVPYYCKKHGKICKPTFTLISWWKRYAKDTLERIVEFDKLRTNAFQICLAGDSQTLDLYAEIKKRNSDFATLLQKQKLKGIFSTPPYVGLIDYHEQRAYSYEIFGFERKGGLEIGSLSKGTGKASRDSYIKKIAQVLKNMKKHLQKNYHVFLVANDKWSLYPRIAELADMKIIQ